MTPRTIARIAALAALAAGLFAVGRVGAEAESSFLGVTKEGWAWRVRTGPVSTVVTTVPGGPHLPVSQVAGMPEKISFVQFDTASVRTGERVRSLVLELPLDVGGANVNLDQAAVVACPVVEPWEPAAPMAWDERPDADCSTGVLGVYHADTQSFRFVLDPLLSRWRTTPDHGLSLEPAADSSAATFQVVFEAAADGGVTATLVHEESEPPVDVPDDPLPDSDDEGFDAPVVGEPVEVPLAAPEGEPGMAVGTQEGVERAANHPAPAAPETWQWVSFALVALITLVPAGRGVGRLADALRDDERLLRL